jgi:hypothetical protein
VKPRPNLSRNAYWSPWVAVFWIAWVVCLAALILIAVRDLSR